MVEKASGQASATQAQPVHSKLPHPREKRRYLSPREKRKLWAPARLQSDSLGMEVLSFLLLTEATFTPQLRTDCALAWPQH